jgi:hypothetical protein
LTEKLNALSHQALSNQLKLGEISGRESELIDNFEDNEDSRQSCNEDSITACHNSRSINTSRTSDVHQRVQDSTFDDELENQYPTIMPLSHDVQTHTTSNVDPALQQQTADVKQRLGSSLSHFSNFVQLQVAEREQTLQETHGQLEVKENQCKKLGQQDLVHQNEIVRQSQGMKESAEGEKRLCNVTQGMKKEKAKVPALKFQIQHIKESHDQSERMLRGKIVTFHNAESDTKQNAHQLKVKLELDQTEINHKKETEVVRALLRCLSELSQPQLNPDNVIGVEKDLESKTGQLTYASRLLVKKHLSNEIKVLLSTRSEKKSHVLNTNITLSSPATIFSLSSSGATRNQTYTHHHGEQARSVLAQKSYWIQKIKGRFISPVESSVEVALNAEEAVEPSNNVSKSNEVELSEICSLQPESSNSNDLDYSRPILFNENSDKSPCNTSTKDNLREAESSGSHIPSSKFKVWPIVDQNCNLTVQKQEIVSKMDSKASSISVCERQIKYDSSVCSSPSAKVQPVNIRHMRDRIEPLGSECMKVDTAGVTTPDMLGLASFHLSTDIPEATFGQIGQLSARAKILEAATSNISPPNNVACDGGVSHILFASTLSPKKAVDGCTSVKDLRINSKDEVTLHNQKNLISVASHSPKAKVFPISRRNILLYNTPIVVGNFRSTNAEIRQPVMYPPSDTSKLVKASKVLPLCK